MAKPEVNPNVLKVLKDRMVEIKRAENMQKEMAETVEPNKLERENWTKQRTANAEKLYKDFNDECEKMINSTQMGYDNFLSCMSAIMGLCHKMAEALGEDNVFYFVGNKLVNAVMPTVDKYYIMLKHSTVEKITKPEVTLPTLQHNVEFVEGGVKVNPITDNLAIELPADKQTLLNTEFSKGIQAWLKELGYTPVPVAPVAGGPEEPPIKYKNGSGVELTEAKFKELKNDPDTGLKSFLSGHFKVNFTEAPPTSSLRP